MPKHNKNSNPVQFPINESKNFHPLVAQWLTDNGYTFEHEYKMPDFGRADYFATHKVTKRQLLVECKCDKNLRKAIIQVAAYRLQIPEADATIAVPSGWLSDRDSDTAARYEVNVVEIDVSDLESISQQRNIAVHSTFTSDFQKDFDESIRLKDSFIELAMKQQATIDHLLRVSNHLLTLLESKNSKI